MKYKTKILQPIGNGYYDETIDISKPKQSHQIPYNQVFFDILEGNGVRTVRNLVQSSHNKELVEILLDLYPEDCI